MELVDDSVADVQSLESSFGSLKLKEQTNENLVLSELEEPSRKLLLTKNKKINGGAAFKVNEVVEVGSSKWTIIKPNDDRTGQAQTYYVESESGDTAFLKRYNCMNKIDTQNRNAEINRKKSRLEREVDCLKSLEVEDGFPKLLDYNIEERMLVLSRIEGSHLKRWICEHNLTLEKTINLFESLLTLVSTCHKYKIYHRDIKPQNIMITNSHQLVLVDFGIAYQISSENSDGFTDEGSSLGPKSFCILPELQKGKSINEKRKNVSDITLCCAMFWWFLNPKQFDLTAIDLQGNQAISRLVLDKVLVYKLQNNLHFISMLHKGLQNDVSERWQSIGELLQFSLGCNAKLLPILAFPCPKSKQWGINLTTAVQTFKDQNSKLSKGVSINNVHSCNVKLPDGARKQIQIQVHAYLLELWVEESLHQFFPYFDEDTLILSMNLFLTRQVNDSTKQILFISHRNTDSSQFTVLN